MKGRGGQSTEEKDLAGVGRGRHLERYSVITITLRYVFVLSQNTLTLLGNIIASIIHSSWHIGALLLLIVIALCL